MVPFEESLSHLSWVSLPLPPGLELHLPLPSLPQEHLPALPQQLQAVSQPLPQGSLQQLYHLQRRGLLPQLPVGKKRIGEMKFISELLKSTDVIPYIEPDLKKIR